MHAALRPETLQKVPSDQFGLLLFCRVLVQLYLKTTKIFRGSPRLGHWIQVVMSQLSSAIATAPPSPIAVSPAFRIRVPAISSELIAIVRQDIALLIHADSELAAPFLRLGFHR
jgi:hypothetical protein